MVEENYTGLACPEPVMRCKKFLSENDIEQFQAFVDNEAASENVERFLKKNGYHVHNEKRDEKLWALIASKEPSFVPEKSETPQKNAHQAESETNKTLIIISSEFFGSGDDILGTGLMGNFLATLPELGENLWKIVLVNGGVKLSSTEGKALEALQKHEANNVEILVCGTCLEFYSLTKEKKVGQSTNMLDIVTAIDLADKVLKI